MAKRKPTPARSVDAFKRASAALGKVFGAGTSSYLDRTSKSVDKLSDSFDKLTESMKNINKVGKIKIDIDTKNLKAVRDELKDIADSLKVIGAGGGGVGGGGGGGGGGRGGVSPRTFTRVGSLLGTGPTPLGGLTALTKITPATLALTTAATYLTSKAMPALENSFQRFSNTTIPLLGTSFRDIDKSLTRTFEYRPADNVRRLGAEIEKLTDEKKSLEDIGLTRAGMRPAGRLAGQPGMLAPVLRAMGIPAFQFAKMEPDLYGMAISQIGTKGRKLALKERGEESYFAGVTSPETLAERRDLFKQQRAEYLSRQISGGELQQMPLIETGQAPFSAQIQPVLRNEAASAAST